MRPVRLITGWFALLALAAVVLPTARGEIIVLKSGGRIMGEVVDRQGSRDTVTLKTPSGAQVTLAKSEIEQWIHQRPGELEYEQTHWRYADTVEGQWALAEWCRQRSLSAQREKHLRRIIAMEPNHQKARLALGYVQIGGQWTTREEVLRKQGMQYYKGRWRLPQEIELEEEKRKTCLLYTSPSPRDS